MQTKTSEILEITSALAVVISLIFVGFEIRSGAEQTELNTQAMQISAYQDLIGRIVDLNMIGIQEPWDFDELIKQPKLSPEDTRRVVSFMWILFRHGDMAFFQYQNGAIDEARLRSALGPLIGRIDQPNVIKHWNQARNNFVPEYRDYVDALIAERASE